MILDFIYPTACGFCGKINKDALCKKCENKLKKQVDINIEKFKNYEFQEHIYFFEYEGFVRRQILNYKFRNKAYLYKSFGKFIIKNEKFMKFLKSYDIIIPVPISKKRKKKRGYNQSLLIAREIVNSYNKKSQDSKLKLNNRCLYKTKNTIEQSKLDKNQRAINVQGVYSLQNKQILENKKILLIDDIYTTGNTVRECSQMIKKGNPKKIGVLTIAKDFVK